VNKFLNTKEVSEYLGLAESTIRAWVKAYKIPYSKLGRSVRFDIIKMNGWLKSKECRRRSPLDDGKSVL
jgi:excisionase family DNA binding protein